MVSVELFGGELSSKINLPEVPRVGNFVVVGNQSFQVREVFYLIGGAVAAQVSPGQNYTGPQS